jgi:hypothetical protein
MAPFDIMQAHGLDCRLRDRKWTVMTRTPLVIALAAAAALAGCNKENHTIVAGPDAANEDTNVATNAPVELPPAIASSKTYRCADNKLVYVDWLADNKTANVRTEENGSPTQVKAAEAGKPMTAGGGYEIDGAAGATTVKIAIPGHPSQSCKA